MTPPMPASTGISETPTSKTMRCRRWQMGVGANRGADRGETVAGEQSRELLLDALDEAGSVKDQRAIELHQRGTGADLLVGVGARGDAADADDRQLAAGEAIHLGEQRRRGLEERRAAQPAGLVRRGAGQRRRPRD